METPIYTLRRTTKNRGIRVKVALGGEVIVSAGKAVTDSEIADFLYQHRRWLAIHIEDMKAKSNYLDKYSRGDRIMLHGISYPVQYVEQSGRSIFDGVQVTIYTTGDKSDALKRWYSAYATAYLEKMFGDIAHDICPMRVKSVKTYYGICYTSSRGNHIYLNSALVHADDDCIRYVIHHEMVHLSVSNHGARFYYELEKLEPNYKILEKRLKETVRM